MAQVVNRDFQVNGGGPVFLGFDYDANDASRPVDCILRGIKKLAVL